MKSKTRFILIVGLLLIPFSIAIPKSNAYIIEEFGASCRANYSTWSWVEVDLDITARFNPGQPPIFTYGVSGSRSGLPWYAYWIDPLSTTLLAGRPKSQSQFLTYIDTNRYITARSTCRLQYWVIFLCITVSLYAHVVFDKQTGDLYGIALYWSTGPAVIQMWMEWLAEGGPFP